MRLTLDGPGGGALVRDAAGANPLEEKMGYGQEDRDRMAERAPAYAREGFAMHAGHADGKFEGEWDGWVIDIEYERDGEQPRLTAVWSGPWNVLPLLTDAQRANIEEQAYQQMYDL